MNNKGQVAFTKGFAFLTVFAIFTLALFATIEPFKETFDDVRGSSSLNCPGTPSFNQSDFDDDDTNDKLMKRTTCFVTGIGMVWFIFAFLIASVTWVSQKWTGKIK